MSDVKQHQKSFLDAIGLTIEEVATSSGKSLWDIIFGFCSLNDVLLILEEPNRLVLATFCNLDSEKQSHVVDDFCARVLSLKKDFDQNDTV